jgi:hypothetical protein
MVLHDAHAVLLEKMPLKNTIIKAIENFMLF